MRNIRAKYENGAKVITQLCQASDWERAVRVASGDTRALDLMTPEEMRCYTNILKNQGRAAAAAYEQKIAQQIQAEEAQMNRRAAANAKLERERRDAEQASERLRTLSVEKRKTRQRELQQRN